MTYLDLDSLTLKYVTKMNTTGVKINDMVFLCGIDDTRKKIAKLKSQLAARQGNYAESDVELSTERKYLDKLKAILPQLTLVDGTFKLFPNHYTADPHNCLCIQEPCNLFDVPLYMYKAIDDTDSHMILIGYSDLELNALAVLSRDQGLLTYCKNYAWDVELASERFCTQSPTSRQVAAVRSITKLHCLGKHVDRVMEVSKQYARDVPDKFSNFAKAIIMDFGAKFFTAMVYLSDLEESESSLGLLSRRILLPKENLMRAACQDLVKLSIVLAGEDPRVAEMGIKFHTVLNNWVVLSAPKLYPHNTIKSVLASALSTEGILSHEIPCKVGVGENLYEALYDFSKVKSN